MIPQEPFSVATTLVMMSGCNTSNLNVHNWEVKGRVDTWGG